MSGRRAKALRREFIAQHGRSPRGPSRTKGPAFGPSFTLDAKREKAAVERCAESRGVQIHANDVVWHEAHARAEHDNRDVYAQNIQRDNQRAERMAALEERAQEKKRNQ